VSPAPMLKPVTSSAAQPPLQTAAASQATGRCKQW